MDPRRCEKIVPVLWHFVMAQVRKLFELHSIYGWFGAQLAAAPYLPLLCTARAAI